MRKSITIRDVPGDTAEELAARAALTGRSLQEYLRAHLIELVSQPDPAVLMARALARKESTGRRLASASTPTHRHPARP